MANLKDVIYLSNEDYETLVSTGTVTIEGETLTYNENNVYVTPDKLASHTEAGLMSSSDKIKLDSVEAGAEVNPEHYLESASVSGTTLTLTPNVGNPVTFDASTDNQTVKGNGTAFGANDVVDIKGSGIISVSGNASTKEITISASHQSIKSLDTTATTAQSTSSSEAIAGSGTVKLHKISKTGSASDLINDRFVRYDTNSQDLTATQKTNARTNIGASADFILTLNHTIEGTPKVAKFLTIDYNNYTSEKGAYFKLSANSCHGNGSSYQYLEDIIIGCTNTGTVVCEVFKYCQTGVTYEGTTRYNGDVFYVKDTINKLVDFYILCGQFSSSKFTPVVKIGSATIDGITQYTGTATYYSSGDKIWANGCGTIYARKSDLNSYQPKDADLTAIANLGDSSTGFLKKTAANTWSLTTAVTSVATSGTGLSGGTITTTGTITLDSSSAGNAASNKVVLRNAAGSIQTEKLAVSSGVTTKATMQYNSNEDCIDFVFES